MGMPVVIPYGVGGGGETEPWPIMAVPLDIPQAQASFEPPIVIGFPLSIFDAIMLNPLVGTSTVIEA